MNKQEAQALANEMFADADFSTHLKTANITITVDAQYDPVTGLMKSSEQNNENEPEPVQWTGFILPKSGGFGAPFPHTGSDAYDGAFYFLGKTTERPTELSKESTLEADGVTYRITGIQDKFDILTYLYLDVVSA